MGLFNRKRSIEEAPEIEKPKHIEEKETLIKIREYLKEILVYTNKKIEE